MNRGGGQSGNRGGFGRSQRGGGGPRGGGSGGFRGGGGGGGGGGPRGGGGNFRGGGRGANFHGGARGGGPGYDCGSFGRQAPPSEIWKMPVPQSSQKVGPLPAPKECRPLPEQNAVIPLQKPKAPGQLNFARIECLTNYYELKLGDKYSAAYFYTVNISKIDAEPKETGKKTFGSHSKGRPKERKIGLKLNRKIFAQLSRRDCGDQILAYDGRQRACGMRRIPNDSLNVSVTYESEAWKVILEYEKVVPLSGIKPGKDFGLSDDEEESLMTLAVIMNHMPSLSYTPLGKGFYGLPGEVPRPMNGGFELWTGYKAHVIPGANKLYFNVNHAVTAFIKPGKIVDVLPELIGSNGVLPMSLSPRNVHELRNKLSRCRAETLHLIQSKRFTIASISTQPASKLLFTNSDGRKISVAEYFKRHHEPLKFPQWPCVEVGFRNPTYYPLEVVTIPKGEPFRGEQSPQLTRDIIRHAAIQPRNRLAEIRATVGMLQKQSDLDREFDIQIGKELVVPARILPPPKLVAAGNRAVRVNPGVIEFQSNKFFLGSAIDRWTVIVTDEFADQYKVQSFVEIFRQHALIMGVQLGEPLQKEGARDEYHSISDRLEWNSVESSIEAFVTKNDLEFVLFVISENSPIHSAIKFVCDVKLGVSSKCIKTRTIDKVLSANKSGDKKSAPDACIVNLLYGLNPKFDGENVIGVNAEFAQNLLSSCPTLIIGIDVNHGQAKVRDGKAKMPSTVGIVGTRNMNATLYNAFMRAQRKPPTSSDREIIQEEVLKPAMQKILKGFERETKRKPQRIIVYRDGVSNGQFNAVLQKEMRAIIEVCREVFGNGYRPPITFMTVQKRHDTRLFPKQVTLDRRGNEKQNPIAGTVVDEVMTGSRVWNFFLASQEGIQGTSKPAHYTVLADENDFNSDQLQSLTYYLCHLYGKCPRAVSLPAPVYYAHHVAFRAAELGMFKYSRCPQNSGREVEEEELFVLDVYNKASNVKEMYAGSMYFL